MYSSRLKMISKKLIKPSFTTPPPLRSYKLGLIDQLMNNVYMPMAFFYPNKHNNSTSQTNTTTLLEKTLSKVLASYYPFAGRIVDNLNIDCNNEMGANFIEAHVDCKMSQISSHQNIGAHDVVFPRGLPWRFKHDETPLVAQLTRFDCGGVAISLCLSHKLGDAQTLSTFAHDWAVLTRQQGDNKSSPSPQFNAASLLPPIEDPSIKPEFGIFSSQENSITKRFIFNSSKISQLKARVSADSGITNPTRVEVVTSLLYKCAYAASSLVNPDSSALPVFSQVVNIRNLMNPPLPPNSIGNMVHLYAAPFPDPKHLSFPRLASELRRTKMQFLEKFKGISAEELREEVLKSVEHVRMISGGGGGADNVDQYFCTSNCRFPLYDIDFGWGNPEKVSYAATPFKNFFILMDAENGDGVEAFVPLEEKIMDAFERDPELLQFASSG
nr:BAHD acyltransferase [Echium plantagineum]